MNFTLIHWFIAKQSPFDRRTDVHKMSPGVGDGNAHGSTLGVAIVGMEQPGLGEVVNSGLEWGEFESRARSFVSDRYYGDLQTVLSSDLGVPRLRTVININCLW